MPTYEITAPDGKTYEVTAPEGASEEQVLQYVQSQIAQQPAPAAQDANPPGTMVGRALTKAVTQPFAGSVESLSQAGQGLVDIGQGIGRGGLQLANRATQLGAEGLQAIGVPVPQEFMQAIEQNVQGTKATPDTSTLNYLAAGIPELALIGSGVGTATQLARAAGLGAKAAKATGIVGGGAASGAVTGALQPLEAGQTTAGNVQTGAAIGALAVPVISGLFKLGAGGVDMARRVFKGLDAQIAADLANYLTPEQIAILRTSDEAVPGVQLTTAETLEKAGAPSVGLRQEQDALKLLPEDIRAEQQRLQASQQALGQFEQQQAQALALGARGQAAEQVIERGTQDINMAEGLLRQFDEDQATRLQMQKAQFAAEAQRANIEGAERNLRFNDMLQASQNKINRLQDQVRILDQNQILTDQQKNVRRIDLLKQIDSEQKLLDSRIVTANDVLEGMKRIDPAQAGEAVRLQSNEAFSESMNNMKRLADDLGINDDLDNVLNGTDIKTSVDAAFTARNLKNIQDLSPFQKVVSVVNEFAAKPSVTFNNYQSLVRLIKQDIEDLQSKGKTEQSGLLREVLTKLEDTFQSKMDQAASGKVALNFNIPGGQAELMTPQVLKKIREGKEPVQPKNKPQSLTNWIIKQGGINNENPSFRGEVKHVADGAKGRPGLINNKRGLALDTLAHRAQEAGFFPGRDLDLDPVQPDDLMEALRRDLSGDRVYDPNDPRAGDWENYLAQKDQFEQLQSFLSSNGIDLAKDTDAQIIAKMRAVDAEMNPQAAAEIMQKTSQKISEKQKNFKIFQDQYRKNIVEPFYNETVKPVVGYGRNINQEDVVKRFLSPNNITEARRFADLVQRKPEMAAVGRDFLEDSLAQASSKNGQFDLKGYDQWFKKWISVLNALPEEVKASIGAIDNRLAPLIADMAATGKSVDSLKTALGTDITRAEDMIAKLDDRLQNLDTQGRITDEQRQMAATNINKARDSYIRKRDEAQKKLAAIETPEAILDRVAQRKALAKAVDENNALKRAIVNTSSSGRLTAPEVAISNAIKSPAAFDRLYAIVRTDPKAVAGLRRATWDAVSNLPPNEVIDFMQGNAKSLNMVFDPAHIAVLKNISDYNRILAERKLRISGVDEVKSHNADLGLSSTISGVLRRKGIRKLLSYIDAKQSEQWQKALYDKDFAVKLLETSNSFEKKNPEQKEKALRELNRMAIILTVGSQVRE
jgi:hypothetical protein